MNSTKFDELIKSIRLWNLALIIGITFILFSLLIFTKPEVIYISLATAFSITLLFTGVLEIISSIQNREFLIENGFYFTVGILDILVSIIIISRPQAPTEILTLIFGYVLLYRVVKLITWSTELKYYVDRNMGWVFMGFVIGTLFSFYLLWDGTFSTRALLFFASFTLLMIGISEIRFSSVLSRITRKELAVSE